MVSVDDGASWSAPVELASTADASDHPLLASAGGRSFLSWMTRAEGYRLLPLDDTQ
jgi:DNA-binding IclR family transcriptional regulator